MTLTRRGWLVVVVVLSGAIWGWAFGIQAMNAVVLPGVIALGSGWILVRRAEEPTVDRRPINPGFPEQPRVVELDVNYPGSLPVEIADTLPAGIEAVAGETRSAFADTTLQYRIASEERGERRLGPVTVSIYDPFRLIERDVAVDAFVEVLTYPQLVDLEDGCIGGARTRAEGRLRERHAFEGLREYAPGDPLRDIHWPSSAKRPGDEWIVKEFATTSEDEAVRIVGTADPGRVGEMTRMVGSIAMRLLDDGRSVGIHLGDRSVAAASGPRQRRRILSGLARTEGGDVDIERSRSAGIVVRALEDESSIETGDRTVPFDRFRADSRSGFDPLVDRGNLA